MVGGNHRLSQAFPRQKRNTSASLRGAETARKAQEPGTSLVPSAFVNVGDWKELKVDQRSEEKNKQKLNRSLDYRSSTGCCGVNIPAEGGELITDAE